MVILLCLCKKAAEFPLPLFCSVFSFAKMKFLSPHFAKISVLCLQMLVKNGILSVYELQEKYENRQH